MRMGRPGLWLVVAACLAGLAMFWARPSRLSGSGAPAADRRAPLGAPSLPSEEEVRIEPIDTTGTLVATGLSSRAAVNRILHRDPTGPRRITWGIEPGEVATPPEGTVLKLRAMVGSGQGDLPPTATVQAGRVVGDGFAAGAVSAIAVTGDGLMARLWCASSATEGAPTSFRKLRRLDVWARWSDGSPASGLWISARNQGNNPFGPAAATDGEGHATLDGLEGQVAVAYVDASPGLFGHRAIGSVNLDAGDGRLETILPLRRLLTLRLSLDGRAGVPPGLTIDPPGDAEIVSRVDAAGLLEVRAWPPEDGRGVSLFLEAPSVQARTVEIGSGAWPTDPVDVALRSAGRLDVVPVKPEDRIMELRLEHVDAESGLWVGDLVDSLYSGPGQGTSDASGTWHLDSLRPGRYRVRDVPSGAVSSEVDVVAGPDAARVRIDLSRVGFVAGRVEVPEGESAASLFVHVDGVPTSPFDGGRSGGVQTDGRGAFQRLRVPGIGPVTILADHPYLAPADVGGRASVTAGQTDVVLRLVRTTVARLRFDPLPFPRLWDEDAAHLRVRLWKGPVHGPAAWTGAVTRGEPTAKFGGFPPGRYTVLFDLPDYAPVVRIDVDLTAAESDLGTIPLIEGSTLVFSVRAPQGQVVPLLQVTATSRNEALPVVRAGVIREKARLGGFSAGTWRVRVDSLQQGIGMSGRAPRFDQDVVVDGTSEVEVVVDAR